MSTGINLSEIHPGSPERDLPGPEPAPNLAEPNLQRAKAEAALRESENRLASELADARTLQRVSGELIGEQQAESLYNRILDAAIELMKSDAASIQVFVPGSSELHLLASRNFHPISRSYWQKVKAGSGSTCGQALLERRRILASDVENCPFVAGTQNLEEFRRSNIRSCQSTPLVSRSGKPLGMISTHWSRPHQPDESDFALFDVLVRQAADLIEHAQAKEALILASTEARMWQRLYKAVLANTPDLGYVFDLDHRFTFANDALLKMWGRTWDDAIGKNCLELGYPSWHAAMHNREIDCVVANKVPIRGEVPFTGTYGRRIYDYIFFPVLGSDGEVEAVGGTTRDITDIRMAESALRESEERFRLFVDNVREYALVQTDLGYCITTWNPGAERMFGYSSHEVLGKGFSMLLAPEDIEANILGNELDRVGESGRNEDARWFVRKDGSRLWTRWVTEPVRDESGTLLGLAKVLRDETERQRLENSARQSEKLVVVGRLASSIAHEINNPLEAVTNLLYLARQSAVAPDTIQYLDQAELELRRVTHIATETLKFHRQSSQPSSVDVVEIVESVLALHGGRIREAQIAIERSYRPHMQITCLPSEIRQVLANLIGNAIDAMAKSSERRLQVRIQNSANPRTGEPGVRILVADTGAGVNRAAKAHLFEPFFTTKESTGTGLGLWVSAEIVKRHHGTLGFRSSRKGAGHGTVFSLFLTQRLHASPAEVARAR